MRRQGKNCYEVGFFAPDHSWNAAAARVHWLNGGNEGGVKFA